MDWLLILQEMTNIINFYLRLHSKKLHLGMHVWGITEHLSDQTKKPEYPGFIDSMSNQFVKLLMINLDKMCEGPTSCNN